MGPRKSSRPRDRMRAEERELQAPAGDEGSARRQQYLPGSPSGTGGDEAAIFDGEPVPHVPALCRSKGWGVEVLSESPASMGGYKEIISRISAGAYSLLKFGIRERTACSAWPDTRGAGTQCNTSA